MIKNANMSLSNNNFENENIVYGGEYLLKCIFELDNKFPPVLSDIIAKYSIHTIIDTRANSIKKYIESTGETYNIIGNVTKKQAERIGYCLGTARRKSYYISQTLFLLNDNSERFCFFNKNRNENNVVFKICGGSLIVDNVCMGKINSDEIADEISNGQCLNTGIYSLWDIYFERWRIAFGSEFKRGNLRANVNCIVHNDRYVIIHTDLAIFIIDDDAIISATP